LQLPFSPLKNSIFDFASGSALKNFSLVFPNESGLFHSLSKEKAKIILTLSPLSPSLSAAMKTALQKLLSALATAAIYAVLGYAFYFLFFASQL
jgi:hypothetical protein